MPNAERASRAHSALPAGLKRSKALKQHRRMRHITKAERMHGLEISTWDVDGTTEFGGLDWACVCLQAITDSIFTLSLIPTRMERDWRAALRRLSVRCPSVGKNWASRKSDVRKKKRPHRPLTHHNTPNAQGCATGPPWGGKGGGQRRKEAQPRRMEARARGARRRNIPAAEGSRGPARAPAASASDEDVSACCVPAFGCLRGLSCRSTGPALTHGLRRPPAWAGPEKI